ncbi:MAG: ABC transporter permease [Elusimicrobia bacterium]|nr:ABC transporter permease [Elusimicrobiota bacterium]
MVVGESIATGFAELWSHKTRSLLSLLAISFGVASGLYAFGNLNLMYGRRDRSWALSGKGRIDVRKEEPPAGGPPPSLSRGLTSADADAIRAALPWVYMVSPRLTVRTKMADGPVAADVYVSGITLDWRRRGWVYTQRGRFFSSHDMAAAARVCIVIEPGGWVGPKPYWWGRFGSRGVFDDYVQRADMLGRVLQVGDGLYTVVGVLKNPPQDRDPRWSHMGQGNILVPLSTAQRYLVPAEASKALDAVDQITVETGSLETIPRVLRRIEGLLAERHRGVADYSVSNFQEVVANMMASTRQAAAGLLAVACVALLAGGIGIMNVTLATVFSRTREIGLRRSVGATRGDILVQFMTEAVLLGVIGGAGGVLGGMGGLRYLAEEGAEALAALCWWHLPAALAFAGAVAGLFSVVPAYRASRLDPVRALRDE